MMLAAVAVITLQSLLDHARTHIHIPETTQVAIEVADRSPMDTPNMLPEKTPIGWVTDRRWGYMINVRRSMLDSKPPARKVLWTVFHELCHVTYDYDYIANWGALSEIDRQAREDRAARCALDLLVRHDKECK